MLLRSVAPPPLHSLLLLSPSTPLSGSPSQLAEEEEVEFDEQAAAAAAAALEAALAAPPAADSIELLDDVAELSGKGKVRRHSVHSHVEAYRGMKWAQCKGRECNNTVVSVEGCARRRRLVGVKAAARYWCAGQQAWAQAREQFHWHCSSI